MNLDAPLAGWDRSALRRVWFGAPHPQPGATHYFGQIGKHRLKWESHTEFVTYTVFMESVADRPFEGQSFKVFPEDWLAAADASSPRPVAASAAVLVTDRRAQRVQSGIP